ncbi:MAG TPA: hypothetical protein VGI43_14660 [Mucilaginibacter sp.]|jgi:hypothetical protein
MKKILLLLIASIITGCSSVDRQVFKARQIFDKYPNEAAKYCGDKFPPADSTVSIKTDTIKGVEINYRSAFVGLELLLDSAKEVLSQKQNKLTDLGGQLSFARMQLGKANSLISNLTAQVNSIQANYKPCWVDTIKNTFIKTRANTAKIIALTNQVTKDSQDKGNLQSKLNDENAKSLHRLYWIIGLCLFIAVYFGVKAYKFLTGGTIVSSFLH